MNSPSRGFSLIELLIVIVLISILMSIGVPGYRQYVQRANRADATTALLRMGAAQERFYIQNGTYASNAQLGLAPPAGLGMGSSERGYYALALQPHADGLTVGYTASATAIAGERQATDDCRVFTLNERGVRGAEDSGGNSGVEVAERCWR